MAYSFTFNLRSQSEKTDSWSYQANEVTERRIKRHYRRISIIRSRGAPITNWNKDFKVCKNRSSPDFPSGSTPLACLGLEQTMKNAIFVLISRISAAPKRMLLVSRFCLFPGVAVKTVNLMKWFRKDAAWQDERDFRISATTTRLLSGSKCHKFRF